jgi:hypothetical protein
MATSLRQFGRESKRDAGTGRRAEIETIVGRPATVSYRNSAKKLSDPPQPFKEDDMTRFLASACLLALVIGGAATPASAACKEQCEKSCMGNDTPTERSNCLIREKCSTQPACPVDTGRGGGTKFDPGGGAPPPSTFGRRFTLPSTGGVLQVVP